MSFSSKPKALATLGVYRKLVHIPKVYHKKEVVRNCEKQIKKGVLMINTSRGEIIDTMPYLKVLKMALFVEQALILLKMSKKLSILTITIMPSRIETY